MGSIGERDATMPRAARRLTLLALLLWTPGPPATAGLAGTPAWQQDGGQIDGRTGGFVASADVNGDGHADVIVGAPYFDTGAADAGRVFVYHGSPTGPSTTPDWTSDGSGAGALFGVVAAAGDVNGDGYDDVIVGSPGASNGEANEGIASVFLGGASGLDTAPVWTAEGNQATAAFGVAVAGAGDVNGDGFSDVIVGAPNFDNGEANEGRVFVYYGSASGPGSSPWTAESNQGSALFGSAVTGGGDFNGDGYADVAVGAPYWDQGATDNGRVFVYHGSPSGLPGAPTRTLDQTPSANRDNAHYGQSLATVGDADGDGYSDLVVGEPDWVNDFFLQVGRASLYTGGASGLGSSPSWASTGVSSSRYGLSVGAAGDLDGDGFADWLVGAPYYDAPTDSGRVFYHHGQASLGSVTSRSISSAQAEGRFGNAVASGDVDGDGFSDVLIGADGYDGALSDEGRTFVYLGAAGTGIQTTALWRYETNGYNLQFGYTVAHAGDVNGDGYPDIIVGSYEWGTVSAFYGTASGLPASPDWSYSSPSSDHGLGRAISSAGDVNGDGYADVVLGEWTWDNGETNEGRALLFEGSASGLAPTPAWEVESDRGDARFGISVSGAGDVNGDGYSDVVVGAMGDDFGFTNAGRAFVYLGSPSGLTVSSAWFGAGAQADEYFGGVVAGVGDVNGDGFADIAVGAASWDNGQIDEGRVVLYPGGPSGPALTPSWSAEGDQDMAYLSRVAPAGDVNGDGFADVVLVAWGYDNGHTDEGQLYVYHGSGSGLPGAPDWTWEPNAYSQNMTASAAGDVNGDGHGDIVVGRPGYYYLNDDDGIANVFFGSPGGITSTGSWSVRQSAAQGARFGSSVGTAGDLDGDGRAEIVAGAPWWQNVYPGQVSEGAVFVYSMPAGRPARSLTVRGGGQSLLVPPLGRAHDSDDFQVRLESVSPHGRSRGKVEVEACPPGVAWGDAGCTRATSVSWLDLNASAGVTDTVTVPGLVPRTLYRWRARTLHARHSVAEPGIVPPANPPHGPWRRMQAQALSGDVRIDQGITVRMSQAAVDVNEANLQHVFSAIMETADGQPNLYPVTVLYQTADGTATAGSDYTAASSSITWIAGLGSLVQQGSSISLAGGDGLSEGPETFSIQLSSPTGAALAAPTAQVVTLIDSDPPSFSVSDTSVLEGDSGTTTADFTITLSYPSASATWVSWETVAGSAAPDSDYLDTSGLVDFDPLDTMKTVQVTVNGDTLDEGEEEFVVLLSNPVGAALGDMIASGTILNDDAPVGEAVTVFVATASNARADLAWVYPSAHDTVRIRYTEGATCTAPSDPETGGTLLDDYSGTPGEPGMAPPHLSLTNGTQYCYRIWAIRGDSTYAVGAATHARPFDNGPLQPAAAIAWAYTTGASSVAAPGLGGDTVLAVSNDKMVHAMIRGAGPGAGLWPGGYRPRVLGGVVQERPAVIDVGVVLPTSGFTLLGSQDGSVYAVDTGGGGVKWRQPLLPGGTEVQAAPSAFFADYGVPWGLDFDMVVAATRNGAGNNRFYALDPGSGAVVGTPYDNGGSGDIGFVSGSASLDYPTQRAYFASRSSGSPNSLWCFDVSASGLAFAWARPAGEIDASPVLRGGVVYTSTIDGDVMAYDAASGAPAWSGPGTPFPTEAGGAKGFIFPDHSSQRLYLSTPTKVWALDDTGTAASEAWSTTAVPAPSTVVLGDLGGEGYVFVGGGDGRLYQLDAATGTQVKWVQLGGPTEAIGAPTLDGFHSMVYAGSTASIIYAVEVPLP